ncbi:MAG: hypothetical protein ACM3US_08310 [Sphingomonadaceae bacterium]
MLAQVSLTVAEAKLLIARAIAALPEVRAALESGSILLKGGSTVSAVAEELVGHPLKISGRVSPRGTRSTLATSPSSPHCMLIHRGEWRNVDGELATVVPSLGPRDVVVLGANLIDSRGGAAMMAGMALGGNPGQVMAGLMAQGVPVLIAAGLEKLTPGTVADAIRHAGMARPDWSLGLAVGLVPIVGRLITEIEALQVLAGVTPTVIGRGGIDGAEGGTTMVVEGEADAVQRAIDAVLGVKGARTSGSPDSWPECRGGSEKCRSHRVCVWKQWGKKGWGKWETPSGPAPAGAEFR